MTADATRSDGVARATSHLPTGRPLVVVTVGSDHHRFDRLVEWVDRWVATRGGDVDCLVQHGPARAPSHALGVDYLDHAELQRLMAAATVVVTQGGPMSVIESRRNGRLPVVVPRSVARREVVDDHQHAFSARMADLGLARLATTTDDLTEAIESGLAVPESLAVGSDPEHEREVAATVERFGRIADGVAARTPERGPSVVMLGGFGRSGSTLLERMLGEVPGVVAMGEVLHLWQRGLLDDERCGCGQPFSACPFWQRVGERAFGGWAEIEAVQAVADRHAVVRNRNLPGLVLGLVGPTRRLRRDRLLRRLDALYAAAAADSRVVIDSSKHPAYAYLLRRASVTLRCVLVVRDPRGVAFSWGKTVVRPEVDGGEVHMPRYAAVPTAVRWSTYGVLFHALRLLGVPVLVVRYEDLVARPGPTLHRVLSFAGMGPTASDLAHLRDGAIRLGPHHTVAGNPMRFRVGEIPLRLDAEWRVRMPAAQRRIVGALTAPLRWSYGYRGLG